MPELVLPWQKKKEPDPARESPAPEGPVPISRARQKPINDCTRDDLQRAQRRLTADLRRQKRVLSRTPIWGRAARKNRLMHRAYPRAAMILYCSLMEDAISTRDSTPRAQRKKQRSVVGDFPERQRDRTWAEAIRRAMEL